MRREDIVDAVPQGGEVHFILRPGSNIGSLGQACRRMLKNVRGAAGRRFHGAAHARAQDASESGTTPLAQPAS